MLRGDRVLLTGGTSFLGTRLAEVLTDEGAELRVLMRDAMKAAMVGRYPIDMRIAPSADTDAFCEAAAGCRVIFHLAHDSDQPGENLTLIQNAVAAARQANARLVYVSSAEVYGAGYFGSSSGTLEESAKKKPTAHRSYAASKLAVEQYLEREAAGVEVVVLEPTIIYGPYSKPWVHRSIELLKTGTVLLPDGGAGSMNLVFVDDVVQALLAAATQPAAAGQTLLVTGPEPSTWGAYYDRLAVMLGVDAVTSAANKKDFERQRWAATKQATVDVFSTMSNHEVLVRAERIPIVERGFDLARKKLPEFWRSLKQTRDVPESLPTPSAVVTEPAEPTPPTAEDRVHLPDAYRLALYRSNVCVSSSRANAVLGYEPRFDFDTGMRVVEAYAKWAYLL